MLAGCAGVSVKCSGNILWLENAVTVNECLQLVQLVVLLQGVICTPLLHLPLVPAVAASAAVVGQGEKQ